jgi:hypothetical protein
VVNNGGKHARKEESKPNRDYFDGALSCQLSSALLCSTLLCKSSLRMDGSSEKILQVGVATNSISPSNPEQWQASKQALRFTSGMMTEFQ